MLHLTIQDVHLSHLHLNLGHCLWRFVLFFCGHIRVAPEYVALLAVRYFRAVYINKSTPSRLQVQTIRVMSCTWHAHGSEG